MQNTTSETELLQASLAGSTEAFGTIVHRYQSLICGLTYSATGDFGRSQELAQETFIRAWKGLSQLKDLDKFRVWLCVIARNLVKRSLKSKRKDIIGVALSLESVAAVEMSEPGPSEVAISKEQEAIVWRALQGIPQKYREAMVLFYREQQSVKQVATGLGLSADLARQRLSRGRKLLKAEVATLVEDVLGRTGPKKTFTIAVIAALPAITAQTATAAVAGVAAKGAPAAKAAFLSGLSGVVIGPVVGLLGGIFGTWMSIKNTRSPRERRFMIKMGIVAWSLLLLLIGLPLVLALTGVIPKWSYWCSFATLFALLPPLIIWGNRRQRQIQKEDGTYVKLQYHPLKISKANIYAAFGGSIFGAVAWIFPMSYITKDWLVALTVLIFAILLFTVSAKKCLREPGKYWHIIITDMMAIGLLNLVVVNLRWEKWMEFYRRSSSYRADYYMPLWGINLAIVAIFSGLLVLFVVKSRKQGRLTRKKEQQAHTD